MYSERDAAKFLLENLKTWATDDPITKCVGMELEDAVRVVENRRMNESIVQALRRWATTKPEPPSSPPPA